ncbi:MAG: LysR substrate-binding domain-containing protein, partial [Adlercreutzia equolifaciens]
ISLRDHNMVGCFDTHEAMVEGVKAGLGWASAPERIASRYRNEPGIIRFKVATDTMWYPVSLTWPSSCSPSDKARDFANFVRENIPEGYFANSTERAAALLAKTGGILRRQRAPHRRGSFFLFPLGGRRLL